MSEIGVATALFDSADRFRIGRKTLAVALSNRMHSLTERRRIEIPKMNLGYVVIERHIPVSLREPTPAAKPRRRVPKRPDGFHRSVKVADPDSTESVDLSGGMIDLTPSP